MRLRPLTDALLELQGRLTPPSDRPAFDVARRLLHWLAVVSVCTALPDLLDQDAPTRLLGSVGIVSLLVVWLALGRRQLGPALVDLADAIGFFLLTLSVTLTWEAPVAMSASLWFRALGGSWRGVMVRTALYVAVMVAVDVTQSGRISWAGAVPGLSAIPVWTALAIAANRMGAMLRDHDSVAAINAMEAEVGAAMVREGDEAALLDRSRDSWRTLCRLVPGLAIVRLELRDGTWRPVDSVGGTPLLVEGDGPRRAAVAGGVDPGPGSVRTPGADLSHVWHAVPAPDPRGETRLAVGAPKALSPRQSAAVVAALAHSELMIQHTRDHLLISSRARTDELTGLGNRLAFFEALAAVEDQAGPVSVVFFDLDRFKPVNDALGHGVGDEVLCGAADAIRLACAGAVVCARLGGDEFAALFGHEDRAALERAGARAEEILTAPMPTSAGRVTVGVSWGYATAAGGDVSELLALADTAMYRTKRLHRAAGSPPRDGGLRAEDRRPAATGEPVATTRHASWV